MCIICNMSSMDGINAANAFLFDFERSRKAMREAADSMLAVSKIAADAEDRKRYNRTHKHMVRLLRKWNKIEQEREAA